VKRKRTVSVKLHMLKLQQLAIIIIIIIIVVVVVGTIKLVDSMIDDIFGSKFKLKSKVKVKKSKATKQ